MSFYNYAALGIRLGIRPYRDMHHMLILNPRVLHEVHSTTGRSARPHRYPADRWSASDRADT